MVAAAVSGVTGEEAAAAQEKAAQQASKSEMQMYQQTRSDLAPYRDLGASTTGSLQSLLTGSPSTQEAALQGLPGYQFTLNQGLQAVQSSAAARGLGSSGAALQGAANYATGLADSTYGAQVNRLQSAANLGEGAAAQTGSIGSQTAAQVGQNTIAAGNAQAQGDIAIGNALQQVPQGLANAIDGGLYGVSF